MVKMDNVATQNLPTHMVKMENLPTTSLVSTSAVLNPFPTQTVSNPSSLFPALPGFLSYPPAFMSRPDLCLSYNRFLLTDPVKTSLANFNLASALNLATQQNLYKSLGCSSPEEPAKKIRRTDDTPKLSDNECPCCHEILSPAVAHAHLRKESESLRNKIESFKQKYSSGSPTQSACSTGEAVVEISESSTGDSPGYSSDITAQTDPSTVSTDPFKTSKTRYETFVRIKDAQRNRVRGVGKMSAYQMYCGRNRSETPCAESKRAPSNASSGSVTPINLSETETANKTHKYVCRSCQKSSEQWKLDRNCMDVFCSLCWDEILKSDQPTCPKCHRLVVSKDICTINL